MTLAPSGRFKDCSRGRTSISSERSRMVWARNATPVTFGLMKRRSVGRSHAQSITPGICSRRVEVGLGFFRTLRALLNLKVTPAPITLAPIAIRIRFLDSDCFMRRYWKVASVPQQMIWKKFGGDVGMCQERGREGATLGNSHDKEMATVGLFMTIADRHLRRPCFRASFLHSHIIVRA